MEEEINVKDLWAIELLADCVVVVTQEVKEKIKRALDSSLNTDSGVRTIEEKDYEGHTFGIRTDSIIIWKNKPDFIKSIIDPEEEAA